MTWQNQSIFKHNFIEICTSNNYSKPLLGFLLINTHYIIPFSIMSINGILQNFLLIQTLISPSFREKWSTVYRLAYGISGFILSICLMISIFWHDGYFAIFRLMCLILNSICLWISAILAFERMLMQLFFSKLFGMTSQHAIIISILIYLFVIISYIVSMIFTPISLIVFYFHLIGPGVIHIISFCIIFTTIIQLKCYLSEDPINFISFIQILLNQGAFYVAPLCIMLCLIISIVSIQKCFLIVFNVIYFLPPMMSFIIFILPSKTNMKKLKTESICGQFLMKFC